MTLIGAGANTILSERLVIAVSVGSRSGHARATFRASLCTDVVRHEQWIDTALRRAKTSRFWPYKMACVVVKGGKVISSGTNKPALAAPKDSRYNLGQGIHAELAAVLKANTSLRGCTAYIAGWTKGNNLVCSKPCDLCYTVLKEAGIKIAYYHNSERQVCSIKVI